MAWFSLGKSEEILKSISFISWVLGLIIIFWGLISLWIIRLWYIPSKLEQIWMAICKKSARRLVNFPWSPKASLVMYSAREMPPKSSITKAKPLRYTSRLKCLTIPEFSIFLAMVYWLRNCTSSLTVGYSDLSSLMTTGWLSDSEKPR